MSNLISRIAPRLKTALASAIGATLIAWQSTAAGAVPRLLSDELGDRVSVKRFGAKGDGVADDTAAIQSALNFAATLSNGVHVFFPAGDYKVTATLNMLCDKVGLIGDGARIFASGFTQQTVLFSITHSTTNVFPSFKTLNIEGLRIQSANRMGTAFSVAGNGVDQFAAQIHYRRLNITDFHIVWNYGDYAFAPMISECSAAGVDQVFKQAGNTSTGAHFVFDKCLFTAIGNKAGQIPAFDLGGVSTYKFIACDIEASAYTVMTTSGSDVYLYACHMELDVGTAGAGAPLFSVTNTDYGHFAFEHCTGFWWQSAADVPPLYSAGPRLSAFALTASRIIVNNGFTPASAAMLGTYYHPFLCNQAVTLRSPMQPKSGQGFLYSAAANNALSNWDFSGAYTLDFTAGGAAGAVTVVADKPYGNASALKVARSGYAATGLIPIPDGAQVAMITHWGKTTFYSSGQMNLEVHLFNANQQEIAMFTQNITNSQVNLWERIDVNLLKTLADKRAKFVKLIYSAPATIDYQVAYPFVDFA